MCGIFAYYGDKKNATSIAVKGLKKLEYRGYDSFGIASRISNPPIKRDTLEIIKKVGKIGEFKIKKIQYSSSMAIAHTRWATHGGVSIKNCHPHLSEGKGIAVVHNGIIENYRELKKELEAAGYHFKSDTDTEVIPHLIEKYISYGFEQAVKKSLLRLKGRFSVAVIAEREDKMIAARRGSPLIIGVKGDKKKRVFNEFFVASDILPFLEKTRNVMYLDDDQIAVIKGKKIKFFNLKTNEVIRKKVVEISWMQGKTEKGDFDHFMLKEIMDQKQTILRTIDQDQDQIMYIAKKIKKSKGTFLVGCGTASKVCYTGVYFMSEIAGVHVNVVTGSEFLNYKKFLNDQTLMIVVSQSGETADVLEAISVAKKKGVEVLSIVNIEGSSIHRQSDYSFLIKAGPEKAVASTKAATSQMALIFLIAFAVKGDLAAGRKILVETASKINDMLNPRFVNYRIKKIAKKIYKYNDIYIIGRSVNFPMALESAIKIQEVSYIHAQGFAGGELKHGPIALISKGTPCIVLVGNDQSKNDILSNAEEIKARGGYIIGISPEENKIFDVLIKIPDVGLASPIVNIIPVQILAYYLAVLRGKDPDMPRNLAKSVTVK